MAKTHKVSYAMVAYIDGWMKAYNPELGNIDIRLKNDDKEADFNASVRDDIVEFYTIKHAPAKKRNKSDDLVFIGGSYADDAWDEYVFVRNLTWDNKKQGFDQKLAQELKGHNR